MTWTMRVGPVAPGDFVNTVDEQYMEYDAPYERGQDLQIRAAIKAAKALVGGGSIEFAGAPVTAVLKGSDDGVSVIVNADTPKPAPKAEAEPEPEPAVARKK